MKRIYLVIWDNGQEYDHDYKVIAAYEDDVKAQEFRLKWNTDYDEETDKMNYERQLYRKELVYIQEVNLFNHQ